MRTLSSILLALTALILVSCRTAIAQVKLHIVAQDDCGNDGKQRHLLLGMNWTFTEEEIPVSLLPKDSPLRSVSYGGVVQYRFRGLKPDAHYQLRLGFVTDRNLREEVLAIDGNPMGDTIRLAPVQQLIREYDVPRGAYAADGQIDLDFKLLSGPNAVVSSIELRSDDPALRPVLDVALLGNFDGTASGTVVDANSGKAVTGGKVKAVAGTLPPLRTVTGSTGEFLLRIPAEWEKSGVEYFTVEIVSGSLKEEKRLPFFEVYPPKNPLAAAPDSVAGVKHCRISLNGQWQFALNPVGEFWKDGGPGGAWAPISVPGECRMQGFALEHDRESAYRRVVPIPADMKGNRIFVRFHGVYSHARVWVNGKYVRSHHGGFTSWDCEITDYVIAGEDAHLTLGITDRTDEISFGSGYAKHPIGGILRGVELLALPKNYLRQLYVVTNLDSLYSNAQLRVDAALARPANAKIQIRLFDPQGNPVAITHSSIAFSGQAGSASASIPVRSPLLWDAEHPRLYTLEASLVTDVRTREVVRRRIGFREVRAAGRELLVNGKPVKLRGACRHDIHPTQGRSTTPEQDRQDVLLAKEANFNFIRTSHYPPSQDFLDCCDEVGIYVEEETAVCFVGTFRGGIYRETGSTQSDERFTERYLSQLAEMIDRDRNHPGVIIWSIGNENTYGTNFQKEFAYVKAVDRSRPVMFSFPHTVPSGVVCYDVMSNHYPSFDRCLNLPEAEKKITVPVLGDEWMHVACYCTQDLRTDPNIRNFWGESIKRAWENNFECDYSIGGAIWGMVDEVFFLPDSTSGYGQWGILDVWRRKKPEFWHTRKAYSPVRLLTTTLEGEPAGRELSLPLHNRFDHTNIRELRIHCTAGSISRAIPAPDIPPHGRGVLELPGEFDRGLPVQIQFSDASGRPIDEERLTYAPKSAAGPPPAERLQIAANADSIVAKNAKFSVTFDGKSGLLRSGTVEGTRIIEGGPFIHLVLPGRELSWDVDSLSDVAGGSWHCDSLGYRSTDTSLVLSLRGMAGPVKTRMTIDVRGSGEIVTSYLLENPPRECQEAGIAYLLSNSLDRLSWNRQALWSTYPDDHIGRSRGEAGKLSANSAAEQYRTSPDRPWSQDTKDFFLFGNLTGMPPGGMPVSHDFRSMKENVRSYELFSRREGRGLRVESDGRVAARTSVRPDGRLDLFVNTHWSYLNLGWGNYIRPAKIAQDYRGSVSVGLYRRAE